MNGRITALIWLTKIAAIICFSIGLILLTQLSVMEALATILGCSPFLLVASPLYRNLQRRAFQTKYPVAAMSILFLTVAITSSFLLMQMKIGWQRAFTAALGQLAFGILIAIIVEFYHPKRK